MRFYSVFNYTGYLISGAKVHFFLREISIFLKNIVLLKSVENQ